MAAEGPSDRDGRTLTKRERTKAALIRAAAELIGERGYEGASLAAVAARAGMSRGAIYGNFADREALFMAVAEQLWRPISPDFAPGASLPRQMEALGAAVAAEAAARRSRAAGAISFQLQLYALTHPAMRARLVDFNRATYEAAAERLLREVGEDALPLPPDQFVKAVHALIEGLILMHCLTPELITQEVIAGAFKAIVRVA